MGIESVIEMRVMTRLCIPINITCEGNCKMDPCFNTPREKVRGGR